MNIEKAKKELKTRIDHFRQLLNSQIWVETDIEAVKVLLNELDNKDKIIDILLNEVAQDGTPSEFEYRKKRILEICKEKVEGK